MIQLTRRGLLALGAASVGLLGGTSAGRKATSAFVFGLTDGRFGGPGLDVERVERFVHQKVNKRRFDRDVDRLDHDERLRDVARTHAEYIADTGHVTHKGPDGSTADDRVERSPVVCSTVGENVAETFFRDHVQVDGELEKYMTDTEVADSVVEQWMRSPGHRENILFPGFELEGIGVARADPRGRTRVAAVQVFCK